MIKTIISVILLNLIIFLPQTQAQFGILTLVDPDLSAIQPLNIYQSYTFELKYDAIATVGPDNVDINTIDLTVIPSNGIQVISGPNLSLDLCTITLEFIPIIDQFEIIICADDDSPFTQGSAALFRSGAIDVTDCPINLSLDNIIVQDNQYKASQTIASNGTIPFNGNVMYQAGNCISLNPGFNVDPAAEFEAYISGCN